MKKIILLFVGVCLWGLMDGQIKIVQSGFVGLNEDDPQERFHLSNSGSAAAAIFERKDANNFLKLNSGLAGNAFSYAQSKRYTITPAINVLDNNPDIANALMFWGPTAGNAYAGNCGIGTDAPDKKLTVAGDIKATGMVTSSDKRLKSNISEIKYGLNEVLQLNPVRFQYNGQGGTSLGSKHFGIVAQDLRKVVPELVEEFTFTEFANTSIDEEVKALSTEQYLQIRDSEIKYLLINAIKDQQAIIEEKEAEIRDLEERFTVLEEIVHQIKINQESGQIFETDVTLTYHDLASLKQNVPNPFSGQTEILYTIPSVAKEAQINIYSMDGKLMKSIQLDHIGEGKIVVNAIDVPSGNLSYQLVVDGKLVESKQMVITH